MDDISPEIINSEHTIENAHLFSALHDWLGESATIQRVNTSKNADGFRNNTIAFECQ